VGRKASGLRSEDYAGAAADVSLSIRKENEIMAKKNLKVMGKRALSLMLTLAMITGMMQVPAMAAYPNQVMDGYFVIDENGGQSLAEEGVVSVTEDGFTTEYKVTNKSDKEMPFCIGGHPGFNCPIFEGEKFEDYSLVFDNAEGAVAHNCDLDAGGYMSPDMPELDYIKDGKMDLIYDRFDFDAVVVENLPVKKVNLVNRNTGHGVRFEFDSYDAIGFWTPIKMGSPFICLEPWNGIPDTVGSSYDLTEKEGITSLSANRKYRNVHTISFI
jgi:hypothetical protein